MEGWLKYKWSKNFDEKALGGGLFMVGKI